MIRRLSLLLVLFVFAAPAVGQASPITFQFTGTITQTPSGVIDGTQPLIGSYTFDSTLTNNCFPPDYLADTACFGPITAFTLTIGAFTTSLDTAFTGLQDIFVSNTGSPDRYRLTAPVLGVPLTLNLFVMTLEDPTGLALDSNALPLTPPDLAAFGLKYFELGLGGQVAAFGTITSLTRAPDPVPEPGTIMLLGTGIAAVAARRRRSARRDSHRSV